MASLGAPPPRRAAHCGRSPRSRRVDGKPTGWSRAVAKLWLDRLREPSRDVAGGGWRYPFVVPTDLVREHDLEPVECRARKQTTHGSGVGHTRWVVERAFAHLHQFKRLLVRYERRADMHHAMLALGCCLVCFRRYRKRICNELLEGTVTGTQVMAVAIGEYDTIPTAAIGASV